jgi:hypothetical protein
VLKDKEIRLNSYIAVSKENASQYFLNNKPKMETRPHKYFQFMVDHGIENGLIPDSTLFRYFQTVERGSDLFLAMYTTAKRQKNPEIQREDEYTAGELNATGELDNTQFIGSAVFKSGVMFDTLTGQETRTINILDDTTNIKDILVNMPDPFSEKKKQFAARMMKTENNKIKMNLKGTTPKIFITIPLQLEIMSNPSMVNFAKEKNQQILKTSIADHLEKVNEKLIKKTQTKFKGIPYPLPIYSKKYFLTTQEYKKFNWAKAYPRADIQVKVDITIVDYGNRTKNAKKLGG